MHDFLNSQELQIFKFCHVPKVQLVRGLPLFVPPSRGDGGSTHGGSRSCCAVGSGTLSALLQLKLCPYFSYLFLWFFGRTRDRESTEIQSFGECGPPGARLSYISTCWMFQVLFWSDLLWQGVASGNRATFIHGFHGSWKCGRLIWRRQFYVGNYMNTHK